MNKATILQTALACVTQDRQATHGDAAQQLEYTARLWSVYLGLEVHASDVANLMALMKISRSQHGAYNPDDYVDGCGYLALAGELAPHGGD